MRILYILLVVQCFMVLMMSLFCLEFTQPFAKLFTNNQLDFYIFSQWIEYYIFIIGVLEIKAHSKISFFLIISSIISWFLCFSVDDFSLDTAIIYWIIYYLIILIISIHMLSIFKKEKEGFTEWDENILDDIT